MGSNLSIKPGNSSIAPIIGTPNNSSNSPSSSNTHIQNVALGAFLKPTSPSPSCWDKIKKVPVIGHIIRAIIWLFKTIFPCCFSKPHHMESPPLADVERDYLRAMTPQKIKSTMDTLTNRAKVYTECVMCCPTETLADLVSLSGLYEDLQVLLGDLAQIEAQFGPEALPQVPANQEIDPDKAGLKQCQQFIPQSQAIAQSVNQLIDTLKIFVLSSKTIKSALDAARKEIVAQSEMSKQHPDDINERFLLACNFSNYFRAVRTIQALGYIIPDTDAEHQRMLELSNRLPKSPRGHTMQPSRVWSQSALTNTQSIRLHSDDSKGMRNIGNSCYMNSGIQLLIGAPDFVRMVNAPLQRKPGETDNQLQARVAVQANLSFVLEALRGGDDAMVEFGMRRLRATIFCDFSRLHLDTELKRRPGRHPDEMYIQHDGEAFINTALLVLGHQINTQEVRSFTHNGEAVNRPLASVMTDTMIRLPIVPGKNLQQTWDAEFASTPVNDAANGFKYEANGRVTNITQFTKRSRIVGHLPEFIVVQMKRFSHDPLSTEGPQKVFTKVPCDNDGKLDITDSVDPALRQNQGRINYQLVGVQLHHGDTPKGGHYTACRKGVDGKSRHYDDNRPVRDLSQANADDMNSQAYNLIFVRLH